MIITRSQLALVTAPNFAFDPAFLGRMADGFTDFIAADGMVAAEDSPGPLTEIHQNAALLNVCIEGAKYRSTLEDQTRAPGIVRLLALTNELDRFCQQKTGISLEHLTGLFEAADQSEAFADASGEQAEQISEAQLSILNSLLDQEQALRVVRLYLDRPEPSDEQIAIAHDAWKRGAATMIRITDLHPADLATIEALERLGDALDDMRELLTREGVG